MNLYEINEAIQNAFIAAIDEQGEIIGEQLDLELLENLEMARNEKIENLALFVKNLTAESEAYKREKDIFAQREKSARNKAERLKLYLTSVLQGESVKSDKGAVGFRNSERIIIDADAHIPELYLKYKDPEPDKSALKKAIKSGVEIDGVSVVNMLNINIK